MIYGIWGWAPSRRCGFADRFAASSEKDCPSAQTAKYQPKQQNIQPKTAFLPFSMAETLFIYAKSFFNRFLRFLYVENFYN